MIPSKETPKSNPNDATPYSKTNAPKMKKMSPKEIYRTIAFQNKKAGDHGIKITLISDIVTNLFYPYETDLKAKQRMKDEIEKIFKKTSISGEVSEEAFCAAIESLEAVVNDENTHNYLVKMFKRQDRNGDGLITQEEFKNLMNCYKDPTLTEKEISNLFDKIVDRQTDKVQMSMKSFVEFGMKKQ